MFNDVGDAEIIFLRSLYMDFHILDIYRCVIVLYFQPPSIHDEKIYLVALKYIQSPFIYNYYELFVAKYLDFLQYYHYDKNFNLP